MRFLLYDSDDSQFTIITKALSAHLNEELGQYSTLIADFSKTKQNVADFKRAFSIGVYQKEYDTYRLFKLDRPTVNDDAISISAVESASDDLSVQGYVQNVELEDQPLPKVLDDVFGGSQWSYEIKDDSLNNKLVTAYWHEISRKAALEDLIKNYGFEVKFSYIPSGKKIAKKVCNIYTKLGRDTKKRLIKGRNVTSFTYSIDQSNLFTAAAGKGAEQKDKFGDGTSMHLNFSTAEWSKANNDPVDKPMWQTYVEIPEATARFGWRDSNGKMQPRMTVVNFDDDDDPKVLLADTYNWLVQHSVPQLSVTAVVDRIGNVVLGDRMRAYDYDDGLVIETRANKIDFDLLDNRQTKVTLGNYTVLTPFERTRKQLNVVRKTIDDVKKDTSEKAANAENKATSAEKAAKEAKTKADDTATKFKDLSDDYTQEKAKTSDSIDKIGNLANEANRWAHSGVSAAMQNKGDITNLKNNDLSKLKDQVKKLQDAQGSGGGNFKISNLKDLITVKTDKKDPNAVNSIVIHEQFPKNHLDSNGVNQKNNEDESKLANPTITIDETGISYHADGDPFDTDVKLLDPYGNSNLSGTTIYNPIIIDASITSGEPDDYNFYKDDWYQRSTSYSSELDYKRKKGAINDDNKVITMGEAKNLFIAMLKNYINNGSPFNHDDDATHDWNVWEDGYKRSGEEGVKDLNNACSDLEDKDDFDYLSTSPIITRNSLTDFNNCWSILGPYVDYWLDCGQTTSQRLENFTHADGPGGAGKPYGKNDD